MIVNLLAAMLILVAAYLGWWAVSFDAPLWWFASFVAVAGSVGLLRRERWGQFVWNAIALSASIAWLFSVIRVAASGWPYPDASSTAISLLPGLLLLVVCGGGSYAVARHYGRTKNAL